MDFEVEQKFAVDDLEAVASQLRELGGTIADPVLQSDVYFAHPSRDFASTDEALRIRSVAEANFITYKGPKIDSTTKTRREIEIRLADGDEAAEQVTEVLKALGFSPVGTVRKTRRTCQLTWHDQSAEVALDTIASIGDFVEVEFGANDESLTSAKACLASLVTKLGLTRSERRSYLELILKSSR